MAKSFKVNARMVRVGKGQYLTLHVPLRSQSEFSVPSCDVDGSESTSELIRLGDTAYSFSKREEGECFGEGGIQTTL